MYQHVSDEFWYCLMHTKSNKEAFDGFVALTWTTKTERPPKCVHSRKYQNEKPSVRIQQYSINALTLLSTVYTIPCVTLFSMKGLCILPIDFT